MTDAPGSPTVTDAEVESMDDGAAGTAGERFSAGSVIDGRFEVDGVLGDGGMGYVVSARHRELDERVAIKLLLPDKADGAARERLLREAQNASKIKGEHSVRVFDIVTTGPAAPYIVMELLVGESVARWFARSEILPVQDVVDVVVQACDAVGEAHQLRIVHRDLKPSNLFLVERPERGRFVKVLDFGVSKRFEMDPAHELTHSRALLGSPVYAPPEQLRASHQVDRRADIWALGVILYQGLTRKLPFTGETLAEVCTRILQDPPPRVRELRPDIPSSLEATILKCLEKRPERRFASVEELVFALREFSPETATKTLVHLDALRASLGADLDVSRVRSVDPDPLGASTATLAEPSPVGRSPRGARGLAWGALIAVAAAGLVVLGTGRMRSTPSDAAQLGAASAGRPPLVASMRPASDPVRAPEPSTSAETPPLDPTLGLSPAPVVSAAASGSQTSPRASSVGSARGVRPRAGAKAAIRSSTASHPWVDSR